MTHVPQALASAEAAYSLALARVSEIDMRGDADGASLTAALRAFATLPAAVGAQHDHVRVYTLIVLASSTVQTSANHSGLRHDTRLLATCAANVIVCIADTAEGHHFM